MKLQGQLTHCPDGEEGSEANLSFFGTTYPTRYQQSVQYLIHTSPYCWKKNKLVSPPPFKSTFINSEHPHS